MTEEEIIKIFNNLKEYIQNKIDSGEHKIYYNDLEWDVKCVDCITAIDNILDLYNKQKEEIKRLKKPKFIFNAETGVVTKLENN